MLLLSLLAGIIIGLLLKGKLSFITELKIKAFYLVVITLGLQLVILYTPLNELSFLVENGSFLYILSMDTLIICLVYNWKFGWSFKVIIFGTALNLLVIIQNNGYMPIDQNKVDQVRIENQISLTEADNRPHFSYRIPTNKNTDLSWLGEVLYFPVPPLNNNLYSAGDIIISIGIGWFMVQTMLGKYKPDHQKAVRAEITQSTLV